MNKKAISAFNQLMAFIRILLLIIVMFAIIFLINSGFSLKVNTFDAEAELFIQQIVYSKALILYDNDIDRLYQAVIVLDKFTSQKAEENLDRSIYYETNRKVAAKITLLDSDGSRYKKPSSGYMPGVPVDGELPSEDDTISPIYFNKEKYNEWKRIRAWIPGPGGVKSKQKNIFVLIKDGNQFKKGYLEFDVIIPNS